MDHLKNLKLAHKLLLSVSGAFVVLCLVLYVSMNEASDRVIHDQSMALAATVANRVEAVRSMYTKHVVGPLQRDYPELIRPTVKPAAKGEIPLPATFTHLVGDAGRSADDAQNLAHYDLISGWNIAAQKGLRDDFEREGWKFLLAQQEKIRGATNGNEADYQGMLKTHKWQPFTRVTTDAEGRQVMRYLSPDRAGAAGCVNCHNALEKTPEVMAARRAQGESDAKVFQLNELMGALSVTVPIDLAGKTAHETNRNVLILFTVLAAAALAFVFMVIQRTTARIRALTEATARIVKDGDLTQTIKSDSNDELGELANTFQEMVGKLKEVPLAIQASVKDLASAAAEIYAASQEQEAAAQQQSSAVEEVSRTMSSLLEAAGHISDSARGVLSNAERAKETSDLTVRRIVELNGHTSRMAETLDVIREIADRSDLLALNASLEGTRAGEAGRGFSLVAAEMRRLAERVTSSVKDVKSLVSDVRSSGSSTVLATEEAKKLSDSTNESARQISMVTQQQKTATEQVTRGMKDIATVLTQSVSATRQTRTAAENLKVQAERLNKIVARFRFDNEAKA
jgi:methyl-accepting chemotaxis protein